MSLAAEPPPPGSPRAALDLAALVRETVQADAPREVLHLRLGALDPALRRPHHRRLLRDALVAAIDLTWARVFDLPNGDVVAIARPPAAPLDGAAAMLRGALEAAGAPAVRRLRLPEEAALLLTAAAESLGLEPGAAGPPPPAAGGPPLGSAALAAAERALAAADLDPVTVAQAVCRLDPGGGAAEPLWEDRRIDWPALAALVLPGRDLAAAPGLARRFARAAEARLLARLTRPAAQAEWRAMGLVLSPATLDGAAFARFAAALPAGRHGELTLALRPGDLLADPGAAARIGPALRRHGFRPALDDATPGLLALLSPARLGLEVVRLRWTPALPGAAPRALRALIAARPEGVVLAGVDRPAAIAWGWEAGIRLFQGPLVERRRRGG